MATNQAPAAPKDPSHLFLEQYAEKLPDGAEKLYLLDRLKDQLDYFNRSSIKNQKEYRARKIQIIIASSLIPVAVGYSDSDLSLGPVKFGQLVQLAVGLAGAFVAIWEAKSLFMKYRELWFNYRSANERLKQEAWKYVSKIGAYQDDSTRFANLVVNVETILEKENSQWNELIRRESEQERAEAIRKEVKKVLDEQEESLKAKKAAKTGKGNQGQNEAAEPGAEAEPETDGEMEETPTPPAPTDEDSEAPATEDSGEGAVTGNEEPKN